MSKVVTIDAATVPYQIGDFISYDGKVHTVQDVQPALTMSVQIGVSVKIVPIAIKEFKSSEVILVTDSVN